MNDNMIAKIGDQRDVIFSKKVEDLLSTGSKIFFQTHLYPLIKMQGFAKEIYLSFKTQEGETPVLLNICSKANGATTEFFCGGLQISNRNRFEKELLESKKIAEEALAKNSELISVKNDLHAQHVLLEAQNRRLKVMNEQSQDLFKVIAHDLQEPLRKSVMFSSQLLDQNLSEHFNQKVKKVISFNNQVRHMILTLQRYEELEIAPVNFSSVNLQSLIALAIRSLEINLEVEKIEVSYSITCPHFNADAKLLQNLFIELFRNAIKYRKPHDEFLKIEISATVISKNIFFESKERYQYEDFVKITFVDNGNGFDDDSNKIFKIIQRSDQLDLIGIGLAFSRRIVEKHSGSIMAKSIKGKGVGFTILLPKTLKEQNSL